MEDGLADFKAWFFSKPLMTRSYLAACVVTTLIVTFGLISPYTLLYSFELAFLKLNLWRPFTALFFMGKFDFGFLFNIYFAYIALLKVETQIFNKETYADFLWLCIYDWVACVLFASFFNLPAYSTTFLMTMIYIWCKRLPHEEVTFMFGFRVKTGYFPWVYAIAMTLFGDSFMPYLFGIGIGHLYIFIKDIAYVRYHKDYLPTPNWFKNWWNRRSGVSVRRNIDRPAGGYFAGGGVRLD